MKRFLQWVPAVVLLCASVPTAYAQYASATTSDGVDIGVAELDLVAGGKVVDRGILVVLAENAPVHYQAPKIPRFAIIGKEKQFYLGLGGYVRGTVSVDFGNPIDNPSYFTTADIAPVSAGNGAKTQVSMGTSNLFFNFVSLPGHKEQVGAYIDFNFDKEGYDLDLRHAYLTWRNFRAGYSYTLFSDQRCIPQTIDFEGAPSLATVRTSMFAWTWTGKKWRAGAAIESPIYSVTESSTAILVNQRIPSIPLYVAYQWTQRHYTRLAAIARSIQYRNLESGKNKERFGYGVQLSGVWGLTERLNLYYQAIYGDGIADYVQDLNDMNLDLVPDLKNGGKLKGTQQFGFMGGVRLNWTKRIQSNHLFSQVRSYVDHYDNATAVGSTSEARLPWDDQYKYGQYLCNNVFYSIGQLQVGVEYLWGARKNMGGAFAHDNRLQVMAQINF
jgi:hypothetical protein